jgi:hypothetical protein
MRYLHSVEDIRLDVHAANETKDMNELKYFLKYNREQKTFTNT